MNCTELAKVLLGFSLGVHIKSERHDVKLVGYSENSAYLVVGRDVLGAMEYGVQVILPKIGLLVMQERRRKRVASAPGGLTTTGISSPSAPILPLSASAFYRGNPVP